MHKPNADIQPPQHENVTRGKAARFVDVRTRRGRLIFRFDPQRLLVDWRNGQEEELIDLTQYIDT